MNFFLLNIKIIVGRIKLPAVHRLLHFRGIFLNKHPGNSNLLKFEGLTPSAPRRASDVNKATRFPIP